MKLNEIRPKLGSRKPAKRLGRGDASGHGGTSTKGHKGQLARTGGRSGIGFEGGQMPLQRRLPKRGFTNIFRQEYEVVNIADLNRFESGSKVTPENLKQHGLIRHERGLVKILGNGDLSKTLSVFAHAFSTSAKEKITQAGGQVEEI